MQKLFFTSGMVLAAVALTAAELFKADLSGIPEEPGQSVKMVDQLPVLTVAAGTIGNRVVSIPVDPALIAGKTVVLSAEVAQENISRGPHPWNGVRATLKLVDDAGKQNFPNIRTAIGSRDWTPCSVSVKVPEKLKSAEILLGLDWVTGVAHFRNVKISGEEETPDYANCTVTGFADRVDVRYRPGEVMVFSFRLLEKGKPAAGTLRVTRCGDDGKTETHEIKTTADAPAVCRASLDKPGFVMVKAVLLDSDGKPVSRVWDKRNCMAEFGLAGCVAPETLKQGVPEPADFDAFWKRAKEELAAVPLKVLEKKLVKETDISRVYDVKLACVGKRPVSGYLSIPKDAKAGSLPVRLLFHGYGVYGARVIESKDRINFFINAHGIENGREQEYYDKLASGELKRYGFDSGENQNPDSCYFKNMILRDLRGLEFARTLPEWNGREIDIRGGSHGAFQSVAVTALSDGITGCEIEIPWLCDLGGVEVGRIRGWRPDNAPGLGYFDTVNFASRVKVPVKIATAGLSDWICPPSGVWVLFNNLKGPAEMTTSQGYDHAPYPGFNPATAPRFTYRK